MLEILGVIIATLALIASAVFYVLSARQLQESTKRLQRTINVLGHYLKATIKDADVDLNINKDGDIVGLNITLRPDPINVHSHVAGEVTLILGEKEPD